KGRVVMMGSSSGYLAVRHMGAYNSSKFALRGATETWRRELRSLGVRMLLIEPGNIKTPIRDKSLQEAEARRRSFAPELQEVYHDGREDVTRAAKRYAASPSPAEYGATTVARAITARWPCARYRVGKNARLELLLSFFPAWVSDRIQDWELSKK